MHFHCTFLWLHLSPVQFTHTPCWTTPQPTMGGSCNRSDRTGNDVHNELFGGEGINVAVDDTIDAAGDHCHVSGILHEYNVFGANLLD